MADYLVSGQRGAGKSLLMARRIQMTLIAGRRVATNLDVRLEELLPRTNSTARCIRLPDRPTGSDMLNLTAYEPGGVSAKEKDFGDIILDELAVWMNSRDWNSNPERQGFLNYIVLSRKHRWNTFLISQLLSSLDKQVRGLLEHHVHCVRTDRIRIPIVGALIQGIGAIFGLKAGKMPQIHVAIVRYGVGVASQVVDRWYASGAKLYASYDTEQKFLGDYPYGSYSLLPPAYFVDRSGRWIGGHYYTALVDRVFTAGDGLERVQKGLDTSWVGRPVFWSHEAPFNPPEPVKPLFNRFLIWHRRFDDSLLAWYRARFVRLPVFNHVRALGAGRTSVSGTARAEGAP